MIDPQQVLETAVRAADEKHGRQIVTLDMRNVSLVADYFVILHADSLRQVQAITDNIDQQAATLGIQAKIEGQRDSNWFLIDLGDVIVHVFLKDARQFYNLEKLWADAPKLDISNWIVV